MGEALAILSYGGETLAILSFGGETASILPIGWWLSHIIHEVVHFLIYFSSFSRLFVSLAFSYWLVISPHNKCWSIFSYAFHLPPISSNCLSPYADTSPRKFALVSLSLAPSDQYVTPKSFVVLFFPSRHYVTATLYLLPPRILCFRLHYAPLP